jgi:hypothetical protein
MKRKIGVYTCFDCGYQDGDVGLDKNGHPYGVCWGECDGAQYFSHGKPSKVRRLLAATRPLPGVDLEALRARYEVGAPASAPAAPAPPPDKPPVFRTLIERQAWERRHKSS